MSEAGEELVQVRLLGFPLGIFRSSQEHWDGLMREFALLVMDPVAGSHEVPARLLVLVEELMSTYGGFGTGTDDERDQALARGDLSVDLSYSVPVHAGRAAQHLAGMLDEADEFCRQGEELLTLARSQEVRRFEQWYLEEFIDQLSGSEPRPYAVWLATQSG